MPPIVPVILASLAGIIAAKLLGISILYWWVLFGFFILFAFLHPRKIEFIFLLFFFLGGLRYEFIALRLKSDALAGYNGKTISAQVQVLEDPVRVGNEYRAMALIDHVPVLLYSSFELSRHRKLWIKATVKPLSPHLSFYQEKGVHHVLELTNVIAQNNDLSIPDKIRAKGLAWLDQSLTPPYNTIAAGILLGNHREIPRDVLQAFRVTGTYHLLVASGLKVSLVAIGALGLTWFLPLSWRLSCAAAAVFFYAFLIGPDPPILRATTMAIFALVGFLLGRGRESWNAFLLSLLLLLYIFPQWVFDLGFQLSFLSVLGILIFYEKIRGKIAFLPKSLQDSVSLTLSAQLLILIPLAGEFHNLSFISPLANLLAVPLTAVVMAAGTLSFMFHFLSGVTQEMLVLMLWIIRGLSQWPWAYVWVPAPGILMTILTYLFFLGLWFWSCRWGKVALGISLLSILFLSATKFFIPDPPRIAFFDVGRGDASLVSFDQKNVLIDGGGTPGEFRLVPALQSHGINRLDGILLTDPRLNHVNGLTAVIENFPVKQIWLPRRRASSQAYKTFLQAALHHDIPLRFIDDEAVKQVAIQSIHFIFSNDIVSIGREGDLPIAAIVSISHPRLHHHIPYLYQTEEDGTVEFILHPDASPAWIERI